MRIWLTRAVVASTSDIYITMMNPCVPCSTFELMLPLLLSILYFSYVNLNSEGMLEIELLPKCIICINKIWPFTFLCWVFISDFCMTFLCCERCSPRVDWAGDDGWGSRRSDSRTCWPGRWWEPPLPPASQSAPGSAGSVSGSPGRLAVCKRGRSSGQRGRSWGGSRPPRAVQTSDQPDWGSQSCPHWERGGAVWHPQSPSSSSQSLPPPGRKLASNKAPWGCRRRSRLCSRQTSVYQRISVSCLTG